MRFLERLEPRTLLAAVADDADEADDAGRYVDPILATLW